MTDEEFMFHQEVRQKKTTSYGAFHKKNGARSKKCNFPHDYLTKKELLKMNSEPITYDLKKFYSYEEFKKFPKDIAIAYLQRITDTYHIGVRSIATIMFDVSFSTLDTYLRNHLIYDNVKWNSFSGRKGATYSAQLRHDVEESRKAETPKPVEEPAEETVVELPVDISIEEPAVEVIEEKPKSNKRRSGTYTNKKVEEPEVQKSKQSKILKTSMIFDGFDLETFLFLSKRYEGQDIVVELNIHERGSENV